jgi:hypothetical protein
MKKVLNKKILKNEQLFDDRFINIKQEINIDLISGKAEIARLMALHNNDVKVYVYAISWWIQAIGHYKYLNNETNTRFCVDRILEIIKIDGWYDNRSGFDINDEIKKLERSLPDLLLNEKNKIITALKSKLPKA